MTTRIILDILLLLSAIIMPFWFTVIFALILLFYFERFYEIIPIFFLIDLLYGVPEQRFLTVVIVSLLIAIVVYFLSDILKNKLRFYKI